MESIQYGRRHISFSNGKAVFTGTSLTEKAFPGEDEEAFTTRLLRTYHRKRGTIEIVFKAGSPEYAVITFSPDR